MLIPTRCPLCRRIGPAPCPGCIGGLRRAPPAPPPPGLRSCAALLDYDGPGRALVTRLKYGNARDAVPWVAAAMAGLVPADTVDLVTWLPTSPARRRRRGFDQAELLAGRVAVELGRPSVPLLIRRPGPPQTGRTRRERLHRPVFVARQGVAPPPPRVLAVDDVVTTGATFAAAAATLSAAGVSHLHGLAMARTGQRPGFDRAQTARAGSTGTVSA